MDSATYAADHEAVFNNALEKTSRHSTVITTTRHPVQPILSVVWAGFAFAMALTGWGPWRMDVNPTYKAYLGVN